jgi:selenoprotein W-related protein
LASHLLTTYKQKIKSLKLIPAGGGAFELKLNGDLVYSKLKTGEFPDEDWATKTVGDRLKKSR